MMILITKIQIKLLNWNLSSIKNKKYLMNLQFINKQTITNKFRFHKFKITLILQIKKIKL